MLIGGIHIKNKRIEWVDIAKGIAIVLVVIGHSPASMETKTFIYGFHIPLFFFLSGFVFKPEKYRNSIEFLKSKVKTIVMPYLIFSIIEYLIYMLWEDNIYNTNLSTSFIFKGIFYASADTLKMYPILWFLPCLFVVQCLFFAIVKINKKRLSWVISLTAFSLIGYLFSQYTSLRLPWLLDSALTAIVFYSLGYFYKKYDSYVDTKFSSYYTEIVIVSLVVLYISNYFNSTVDLFSLVYNNYFLYYTSAISGIIFCVAFSKIIRHSKSLSFLGKNTILIFVFHVNMFNIINYIIGHIRSEFELQFTVIPTMKWSMFYTSFSIVLILPVILTVKIIYKLKKASITKTVEKELAQV